MKIKSVIFCVGLLLSAFRGESSLVFESKRIGNNEITVSEKIDNVHNSLSNSKVDKIINHYTSKSCPKTSNLLFASSNRQSVNEQITVKLNKKQIRKSKKRHTHTVCEYKWENKPLSWLNKVSKSKRCNDKSNYKQ